MRLPIVILCGLVAASCGTTGVVKMEADSYMVSDKSAKLGFVSAAEEKAEVYKKANAFCAKQNKSVETIKLEMRDSGAFRSASAMLEFRCVDY